MIADTLSVALGRGRSRCERGRRLSSKNLAPSVAREAAGFVDRKKNSAQADNECAARRNDELEALSVVIMLRKRTGLCHGRHDCNWLCVQQQNSGGQNCENQLHDDPIVPDKSPRCRQRLNDSCHERCETQRHDHHVGYEVHRDIGATYNIRIGLVDTGKWESEKCGDGPDEAHRSGDVERQEKFLTAVFDGADAECPVVWSITCARPPPAKCIAITARTAIRARMPKALT